MARILVSYIVILAVVAILPRDARADFQFFDSDGVSIRYLDQGSGDPVVLIHGNTSRIELNWAETGVFDALSANHRVIALDVRGFGESGKPHDPTAYGAEMALDVIRLLDHLSIDRAHIVGYSMGARITAWLVVNRPERMLSAVLGASTYFLDSPENRRRWEASAGEWEAGNPLRAESVVRGNPGIGAAEAAAFVVRHTSINDSLAVAAYIRGRPDLSIREEDFGATTVPILHVYGSREAPRRLEAAERLKTTILPAVESVVLEGATHSGHSALYRHPAFLSVISNFFEKHPAK